MKTQVFTVNKKDKKNAPSWQQVSSEGEIKVSTELIDAPKEMAGFSDNISMDVIESASRFGLVANLYPSSQSASAGVFGYTSPASAGATSGGTIAAGAAGIGVGSAITAAAVIAGGAAAAGSGGGGGGSGSAGSGLPGGTGEVKITLQWSAANVDLDLHVIDPCATEIFFNLRSATCQGNIGTLDLDDVNGGPGSVENIFWSTAPSGTYSYFVRYFAGSGPVILHINTYR